MPLQDCQYQIRDLVMGPGTPYTVLEEFNPFEREVRADATGALAWGHGAWSGAEWQGEAIVPIPIHVSDQANRTPGGWYAAHKQLAAAFRPIGDDTKSVELRFAMGGVEYVMYGRPRMLDPRAKTIRRGWTVTEAAFVALDPFIYVAAESTAATGLPQFVGGLSIPGTVPAALNSNTGAEGGASPWVGTDGTIEQSSEQVLVGGFSFKLTPNASASFAKIESEKFPVTGGADYVSRGWLWLANTHDAHVGMDWYDSTDSYISTSSNVRTVDAQRWSLFSGVFTAPDNAATGQLVPTLSGSSTSADVMHVDQVQCSPLLGGAGGLSVPFSISARLSEGFLDLINNGTAPTPMIWRLNGPAPEPRVVLQRADGTNAQLRYPYPVAAGHYLEVDTGKRTVLLDGVTNRRGFAIGEFPYLPPGGPHRLRWFANEYDAAASFTVTYQERNW